jgi:hypothetical protein
MQNFPMFLTDVKRTLFYRQIFMKVPNIKLPGNPSSGRELIHAERRTDRRTDMTKVTDSLDDFAKAP